MLHSYVERRNEEKFHAVVRCFFSHSRTNDHTNLLYLAPPKYTVRAVHSFQKASNKMSDLLYDDMIKVWLEWVSDTF
jgi:hypothetical protein